MYYNNDLEYPVQKVAEWGIQDGSKVKTYMECPRKYFYEYVLGWRPLQPSNHLIFGSAWHEAMAHLYLNGFDMDNVYYAYNNCFLPYYRKHFDPGDDDLYFPKTPERAFKALAYYSVLNKRDLEEAEILEYDGKKLVEIGGKIAVSDEHLVAFRQDTILKDSRGIFSLEHKTGSSTYGWASQWELAISTVIYTHVLYCLFPPEEVSGIKYNGMFFKKTKDGPKDAEDPFRHFEFLRVPIYKSMEQMGTMMINLIYYLDSIKIEFDSLAQCSPNDQYLACFPQNWGSCTNWGRLCEYHDFCSFWRNPLRHLDNVPMDMQVEHWNPLSEPVNVEVNL